ncbi:unnamed protein product [Closterium sp. NIES-54]
MSYLAHSMLHGYLSLIPPLPPPPSSSPQLLPALPLPPLRVTQSEPFNLAIYAHILPSAPAAAPHAADAAAPPVPAAPAAAARGADGRRMGARALEDGGTSGVGMWLLSALQQPRSTPPSSSSRPPPPSSASSSFLSSSAASSLPCLALSALLCCCRHPFACALLLQPDPRVVGKGATVKGSSAGRKAKGVTGIKKEGDEGGKKGDGGAEKKGEGAMEVEGEGVVEEEEEAVEDEKVSTGKQGKQGGEGKAEAGKSAGGKEKGAGSSGYEQVLAFVVHSSRCRTPLQVGVLATQLLLVLHRHHLCLRLQVTRAAAPVAALASPPAVFSSPVPAVPSSPPAPPHRTLPHLPLIPPLFPLFSPALALFPTIHPVLCCDTLLIRTIGSTTICLFPPLPPLPLRPHHSAR